MARFVVVVHALAIHPRTALEDFSGQVGVDDVFVGQDDQLLAAHVQHVIVGVGLAVHVGVAIHDDALAALFHDGRFRYAYRDRIVFTLAHRARRGDVIRIVVGEVFRVFALQPVDRATGGVGAQHDEIA
ncbi:hypothetical protein FQZ97_1150460 [compost metagenome]